MYIILIGPSGKARKGTAINIGKSLLTKIQEVKITSESVTREALIRAMKNSISNMTDPRNPSKIKMHCSITVISEELSVFLRQNDLGFLSNLTDWYDSRDKWTYETKGSGTDTIEGVCINLLGATAPDWLQSILPEEAIGGGFTSRIIFIVEEKKGKTIPEPKITLRETKLRYALIHDLEQIVLLKGEMKFTPEAVDMYKAWYEEQDIMIAREKPPIDDPRFAGYIERRPTHIKKIAMAISASQGNSMIINADDFERARILLTTAEVKMKRAFGGLGSSRYGQITDKILQYLEIHGKVKRSILVSRFYRDIDPETLNIIETTLVQMKVLKITLIPKDGDAIYEYISK